MFIIHLQCKDIQCVLLVVYEKIQVDNVKMYQGWFSKHIVFSHWLLCNVQEWICSLWSNLNSTHIWNWEMLQWNKSRPVLLRFPGRFSKILCLLWFLRQRRNVALSSLFWENAHLNSRIESCYQTFEFQKI